MLVELSQQEEFPLALLLVFFLLDHALQYGDGFFVALLAEQIVGLRIVEVAPVPFLVALGPCQGQGVFCVVEPVQLCIAAGHPDAGVGEDFRIVLVEPGNVAESGRRLQVFPFPVLCLPDEEPGAVEEGVVFLLALPQLLLGRLAAGFLLGLLAYGVELYAFLPFLYGAVKIAAALSHGAFVADGFQGEDFAVVVLVAGHDGVHSVAEGGGAVVEYVVARRKGVVKTGPPRILLHRASAQDEKEQAGPQEKKQRALVFHSVVFTVCRAQILLYNVSKANKVSRLARFL